MRISKIIFSVAAAITPFLGISAASAADMPAYSKAPVLAPAPVYNWTGFYIGGNVGYSWDNTAAAFSGNSLTSIFFAANIFPTSIGLNTNGVLAGGQFGYNWQVSPMWVVGFETDLQWANIKGTGSVVPTATAGADLFTTSVSKRVDWFGTARGRVGFLGRSECARLRHGRSRLWREEVELQYHRHQLTVFVRNPLCLRRRHQHQCRVDGWRRR